LKIKAAGQTVRQVVTYQWRNGSQPTIATILDTRFLTSSLGWICGVIMMGAEMLPAEMLPVWAQQLDFGSKALIPAFMMVLITASSIARRESSDLLAIATRLRECFGLGKCARDISGRLINAA
jgi:hypothetical protein